MGDLIEFISAFIFVAMLALACFSCSGCLLVPLL